MTAQVKGRKVLTATNASNAPTLRLLPELEPEHIGARIHQARLECGLTQEELASLIGVSTRSLQGYEGGAVKPYRHMDKIAEVTGRSVAWLLHGVEPTSPAEIRQLMRAEVEAALEPVLQILERLLRQETPGSRKAGRSGP